MLDGRNSHNLTLLLLGVKAREIRWKKYKGKINNNWQCLMEEIAWWKKFTQFNTITTRCKSKRNKMKEIQGKNQ